MLVYLMDGAAQTPVRAATLRWKLRIKLASLPSRSIQTPGQPVPALTLQCRAHGRVVTRAPILDPFQTHYPQITERYGLCCLEETTTKLVDCDCFLRITAVTMHHSPYFRQVRRGCAQPQNTLTAVRTYTKLVQGQQRELRLVW